MEYYWYQIEDRILAPQAAFAARSAGRLTPEPEDELRTCFQRDRDRIIHSKAFRRLKTKTQVFIKPYGDHFRTRLTHTLEVMQISRTLARALRLNEDLTEAIALGHDLGHTPFGHAGERSLNSIVGHFAHNEQSLRVIDVLEKSGRGLNLTFEVRDGILNHSGGYHAATLEGELVHLADRIAYINHDIDDAIRAGLIRSDDLPADAVALLGDRGSARINSMVSSVVRASADLTEVGMEADVLAAMNELREYLFRTVYRSEQAVRLERQLKHQLEQLFEYYLAHPEEVPEFIRTAAVGNDELAVCDYIAGMSDGFAFKKFEELKIE